MTDTIIYTDPRTIDGDPFEVAAAAVRQAQETIKLAKRALADAELMARNAELERQLLAGDEPSPLGWPESAQGAAYARARHELSVMLPRLRTMEKAASYNPRKPIPAG